MSGQSGAESDDELLLKNVNDLKKRLLKTERSLQLLQSPKSKTSSANRGRSVYSRYVYFGTRVFGRNVRVPVQLLRTACLKFDIKM